MAEQKAAGSSSEGVVIKRSPMSLWWIYNGNKLDATIRMILTCLFTVLIICTAIGGMVGYLLPGLVVGVVITLGACIATWNLTSS